MIDDTSGTGPTLVFEGRGTDQEEAAWLHHLRTAMPTRRIVPLRRLDDAERRAVRVAIVADPDPEALTALPGLVWVQSLWAGVEGLLGTLPASIGIARLVDPLLSRTMAEAVLAWTLYLHRDMPRYAHQQRLRAWHQHDYRMPSQVTVGVLGLGELGTAAVQALSRHGYRTLGWARSPRNLHGVETFSAEQGLQQVCTRSDILVVLLPATPDTQGLIDARRLASMRTGAAVINFARGAIVDAAAVLVALDAGQLSHAVLDVFEQEPLPTDSPLWAHPGITVLPHVSAPTAPDSAAAVAAEAIQRYETSGELPVLVDRSRGY